MAIEYGNSVEAIQVHISFFIPVATLLNPGPRIYGQEDRHPSGMQGLTDWATPWRKRQAVLPDLHSLSKRDGSVRLWRFCNPMSIGQTPKANGAEP